MHLAWLCLSRLQTPFSVCHGLERWLEIRSSCMPCFNSRAGKPFSCCYCCNQFKIQGITVIDGRNLPQRRCSHYFYQLRSHLCVSVRAKKQCCNCFGKSVQFRWRFFFSFLRFCGRKKKKLVFCFLQNCICIFFALHCFLKSAHLREEQFGVGNSIVTLFKCLKFIRNYFQKPSNSFWQKFACLSSHFLHCTITYGHSCCKKS